MTEKLKQKIDEEILKLPKEKQDAINNSNWDKKIEDISKKYSLTEDEIYNLQLETGLFIIGLVNFNLYLLNIEKNVMLPKEESQNITKEILQMIIIPIAQKIEDSLKNKINLETTSWDKSINFIISGGDYSVFLDK